MASSHNLTPLPKRQKISYLTPEEQIESMKQEIRDRIRPLRDKLDTVECSLLAEVDRLGALQISERIELESKVKELKKGRTNLGKTKKSLEVKSSIDLAIRDLDRKIIEVSQKLNQFQEISSYWRTSYWEYNKLRSADTLCKLSNVKITDSIYKSKSIPQWQLSYGTGPSQLMCPKGIAIQTDTNNIFVSDSQGKRIQVFSERGEHIKLIDTITNPLQIFCVSRSYIYGFSKPVKNSKAATLTEVNLSNLRKRVIDYSSNNIVVKFAFDSSNNSETKSFICYSQIDYSSYPPGLKPSVETWSVGRVFEKTEEQNISANPKPRLYPNLINKKRSPVDTIEITSFLKNPIKPVDIIMNGNIINLLVSDYEYLVLKFNTNFKLIRPICPSSLLGVPRAICIDHEGNIIIAGHDREVISKSSSSSDSETSGDRIDTKILILSKEGDVIHEIILPSENCVGIAVNSNLNLFVLNNDTTNSLTTL